MGRIWTTLTGWAGAILGSRAAIGTAAALFLAFGAHALSAPTRFPAIPLDALSAQLAQPLLGGAPDLCAEFDADQRQTCQDALLAAEGAIAPAAQERVALASDTLAGGIAQDPQLGRLVNGGLAGLAFVVMVIAIVLHARGLAAGRIGPDELSLRR